VTVIAWDGATLAADKRAENSGHAYSVTKIFDCGDALVGVCGHFARGLAMMQWWKDGRDPAKFPEERDGDWATLLVVHRSGLIERFESRPTPIPVEAPFHAAGSGRDFAIMAMHLGHDAVKAVELTCELTVECGNGVDSLRFE
jgi:hypothetical protein